MSTCQNHRMGVLQCQHKPCMVLSSCPVRKVVAAPPRTLWPKSDCNFGHQGKFCKLRILTHLLHLSVCDPQPLWHGTGSSRPSAFHRWLMFVLNMPPSQPLCCSYTTHYWYLIALKKVTSELSREKKATDAAEHPTQMLCTRQEAMSNPGTDTKRQ